MTSVCYVRQYVIKIHYFAYKNHIGIMTALI